MSTCSQVNNAPPTTGVATRTSYYREWNGSRTPNFASVKKRKLPINPHHVWTYTVADGGICETGWYKPPATDHVFGYGPYSFGGPYGAGVPTPTHDLSGRDAAINKLAEGAGNEVNNLAQDLVQVNQLTRAVVDTCKRLTGALTAVKRLNIPLAMSILWQKEQPRLRPGTRLSWDNSLQAVVLRRGTPYTYGRSLANNWLELQYGWKPLLQDVYGAAKSLAYLNAGTFMVQTVRSSKSSKPITDSSSLSISGRGAGSRTIMSQTEIRFMCRYGMGEPLKAFMTQIGFNNPINLLWEIIPYSFVVDWFLPIGQYLEGLTNFQGLTFIDGCETRFTRQSALFDVYYYYEDNVQVDIRYGSYSRDDVVFDRLKLTSWPSMRFPSFKNPISTEHALNALALLRAAFTGQRFYGR
jgi:hypothetical protein